ncbi:DUF2214 family protein [Xylophilus sp.]|uniref:DUF2214 family protein n=1 Tax=Xylophilus sp. TaxID=2653893 RepID=UPI0013BAC6BF|nr:DUF2214 family protein [Xylophilus sp.]KAF1044722.1 MAG: hypothetical protein GAK38_03440 [Xylophilus sp.]
MILEAILAYVHFTAILAMVVFLSSEAALCRIEWMNEALVRRLARVDLLYGLSAIAVLLSGAARVIWGVKGAAWYGANPLLHVKVSLFVVTGLLSIKPTVTYLRWRRALQQTGSLPPADEVKSTRRLVMIQAHLLPLIPLAAVFLARGYGSR